MGQPFSLLDPKESTYPQYVKRLSVRLDKINTWLRKNRGSAQYMKLAMKAMTYDETRTMKLLQDIAEEAYPGMIDIVPNITCQLEKDRLPAKKYMYINSNDYNGDWVGYYNHNGVATCSMKRRVENFNIIIHYPKLTINNTSGYSLDINDMYIRLEFKLHYIAREVPTYSFSNIEGIRLNLSVEELAMKYFHSHISDAEIGSTFRYHGFCLGSGVLSGILGASTTGRIEGRFKYLIKQIKAFLEWESVEGTPYKYMADVISKQSLDKISIKESMLLDAWNEIITQLAHKGNVTLKWELTTSGYKIVDDEVFEAWIKARLQRFLLGQVSNHIRYRGAPILVNRDRQGAYYMARDSQFDSEIKTHEDCYIWFKGERRCLVVQGHSAVTHTGPEVKYIHPKIKYYVKSKLETLLNNSEVRKAGTRRLSEV